MSAGAPLPLVGLGAVGGYSPNPGDRILVKDQTDPRANGIYNASTGAWARSGDFDGVYDAVQGTLIVVYFPNAGSTIYQLTTFNPVIGTTPLTFVSFVNPNQNYPQTAAEALAGVTPTNVGYPAGAIERYYAGSGDARPAIQNALNCNNRVYSSYGLQQAFPVSSYLLVPADVTFENASLIATAQIPQYPGWSGGDHQGQVVLLNGNQAKARHLQINGAGFAAGGIAIRNFANNDASNNEIFNGLSQGILILCSIGPGVLGAQNFTVNGNRVYYMNQGIQHWRARGGSITGNTVRVIAGGGIWGAGSGDVTATGNTITHCGDVGLDMEGGANCTYSGNTVMSCNNGELTWFVDGTGSTLTPTNCLIANNSAWHTSTFLAWNGSAEVTTAANAGGGAMWLTSAQPNQRGITFSNNQCRADIGSALLVNDLYGGVPPTYSGGVAPYDCGFIIDDNKFYAAASTAGLHTVQRAWNIVVKNNLFHAMPGAEVNSNQFKNCSNGTWDNNTYHYEFMPTVAYALQYYTDANAAAMPTSPQITNNKFINCGDNAFLHQPFTSGRGAILFGNLFNTGYTANAGCTATADGFPICRGQKLYYTFTGTTTAALNLASIQLLGNSQTYSAGILNCFAAGTLGANYSFAYASNGPTVVSRDGSGVSTGNPVSATRYATFAGSTITVTGPASSAVVANMALEVTSNI